MENENQHTYDNGFHPRKVTLKKDYCFYNNHFFFRVMAWIVIYFTKFWSFFYKRLVGFKIIGKKYRKKQKGVILVCNHVFPMDALTMASTYAYPNLYVTVLQSNLGFPIFSRYIRFGAAVPIPEDRHLLPRFKEQTIAVLAKGRNILFYPEAALIPFCDHVRPFKTGAFHYAINAGVSILPCCWTFHQPKGIYKLWRRKKPIMHLNYLPLYTPTLTGNNNIDIRKATSEVQQIISDYFVAHSDYYYQNGQKINH